MRDRERRATQADKRVFHNQLTGPILHSLFPRKTDTCEQHLSWNDLWRLHDEKCHPPGCGLVFTPLLCAVYKTTDGFIERWVLSHSSLCERKGLQYNLVWERERGREGVLKKIKCSLHWADFLEQIWHSAHPTLSLSLFHTYISKHTHKKNKARGYPIFMHLSHEPDINTLFFFKVIINTAYLSSNCCSLYTIVKGKGKLFSHINTSEKALEICRPYYVLALHIPAFVNRAEFFSLAPSLFLFVY